MVKSVLHQFFPFEPTSDQEAVIQGLNNFTSSTFHQEIFLFKGYAGTGKTTLISAYIAYLKSLEKNYILMAPTGRAAKVLSVYSGELALTIHKSIYYQSNVEGNMNFTLQKNKLSNAIFIVDEASMIGNSGGIGASFSSKEKTLLDDLIQFVYNGQNCKLILIGDTAQLPPVMSDESPALDSEYLKSRYPFLINTFELQEVTRQSAGSGILHNATLLRNIINQNKEAKPKFELENFADVNRLAGSEIEETVAACYSKDGVSASVVICRSNKQANGFNKYIRYHVLYLEDEVSAADLMMVVRNNYFWLDSNSKVGFIANGDLIEILKVVSYEEKFGFRFANVSMRLLDYPEERELEVKILLDTLYSEAPALDKNQGKALFEAVQESYSDIKDKNQRLKAVKKDEYFNALQVKFGYAITCHKSQGGQWKNVFVDQGYLLEEMINKEFMRWLYTAITRSQEKLYLLNFHERFFLSE